MHQARDVVRRRSRAIKVGTTDTSDLDREGTCVSNNVCNDRKQLVLDSAIIEHRQDCWQSGQSGVHQAMSL